MRDVRRHTHIVFLYFRARSVLNKPLHVSEETLHMNTWQPAGGRRDKQSHRNLSYLHILTTLSPSSTSALNPCVVASWASPFKCSCISQDASRGQAQSLVSSSLSAEWRKVFSSKQQLQAGWQTVSQRVWEDRTGLVEHWIFADSLLMSVCLWCAIFSWLEDHFPEILESVFFYKTRAGGRKWAGWLCLLVCLWALSLLEIQEMDRVGERSSE